MQEVYEFLKHCGTYYLATVDLDQARVRPFGTIDLFDGRLTIQTGRSKEVSRQILRAPKVELCAFDGKTWLRVTAMAVEEPRIEAQEHILAAYPSLRDRYQPGDGNTQIFALEHVPATPRSSISKTPWPPSPPSRTPPVSSASDPVPLWRMPDQIKERIWRNYDERKTLAPPQGAGRRYDSRYAAELRRPHRPGG